MRKRAKRKAPGTGGPGALGTNNQDHSSAFGSLVPRRPADAMPEPFRSIVKRVNDRDRRFFVEHPGVTSYTRPYVEGEFGPGINPRAGLVLVTLIRRDVRARELIPLSGMSNN